MTRFELIRTADGESICAGDTVTVRGVTRTVDELEPPEPDFYGCVHLIPAPGEESTCAAEDVGAEWYYDGQPMRWGDTDDREDFDSGRWTREDTESMERGRDLPLRNEAGEPMY